MKIQCRKLECLECHKVGLAQIFLAKDRISYVRIRHYQELDPNTKKPQFKYCKVSDQATLNNLAVSLGQESIVKASEADLKPLDQKNKIIEQKLCKSSPNQQIKGGRSLVW